jgi:hypothetical protein
MTISSFNRIRVDFNDIDDIDDFEEQIFNYFKIEEVNIFSGNNAYSPYIEIEIPYSPPRAGEIERYLKEEIQNAGGTVLEE